MRWRQVDPVQPVDALLIVGEDAPRRLIDSLANKPAFLRNLPMAIGEDWAALFARPLPEEDQPALPRLLGSCPLYQALPGWWFPVGSALSTPSVVQPDLLHAMAREARISPPIIVVPEFGPSELSRDVDLYPVYLRETVAPA